MKNSLRHENVFLFIILASIIGVQAFYFNANQGMWWDEAVHLGLARSLYEGSGFQINDGQESFRPPMFAALVAGTWSVFGFSETAIRLFPIVFSVLAAFCTYVLGKRMYNSEVGLIAAAIVGTAPMFLFFGAKFLTETFFMFTSILSIVFYYAAIEKNRKSFFIPAFALLAISFMVRYPAFVIGIAFLLYPILTRKKVSEWIASPYFLAGIGLGIAALVPWFLIGDANFGGPFNALFTELETIGPEFYSGPWYFYLRHWIEIFGFVGFFLLPALTKTIVSRRRQDVLLAVLMVSALVFLALIARKEERYIISFLPIIATFLAMGVHELKNWLGFRRLITGAVIFFLALNLVGGIQAIDFDKEGGRALKDASEHVSSRIGEGSTVMTQNMPVLYYMTGKNVVYFPQDVSTLGALIHEKNVEFIVIESREPSYPEYVWSLDEEGNKVPSEIFGNYSLEGGFEESGRTIAWVYRTG
jgi:4-amino-4-deoxy-L-arabinose transferase-like glycosyltransferase